MKTHFALPLLKSWLLAWMMIVTAAAVRLSAATNVVLAGEDLQAKINAAASGDVLVVQSGSYGGDLSIGKALSFVRSGAESLQLLGTVSINTESSVSFTLVQFGGALNAAGNARISATDCRFEQAVGMTGGALTLRRCHLLQDLRITNTTLTALRITNSAWVSSTAAAGSNLPFTMVQSVVGGPMVATGCKIHMGYCKAKGLTVIDGEAILIGNIFSVDIPDRAQFGFSSNIFAQRSTIRGRNNRTYIAPKNNVGCESYAVTGVALENCDLTWENNLTQVYPGADHDCVNPYGYGINLTGPNTRAVVTGSIVVVGGWLRPQNQFGIIVSGLGAESKVALSHCQISAPNPLTGATGHAISLGDPKLNEDGTLAIDSPCRNAGPPDAIHNDRDGTRNDMGFTGGPLYNSSNFTTDLPLAFWLDTTPRKVLKGVNNTIRVDAAATAGH